MDQIRLFNYDYLPAAMVASLLPKEFDESTAELTMDEVQVEIKISNSTTSVKVVGPIRDALKSTKNRIKFFNYFAKATITDVRELEKYQINDELLSDLCKFTLALDNPIPETTRMEMANHKSPFQDLWAIAPVKSHACVGGGKTRDLTTEYLAYNRTYFGPFKSGQRLHVHFTDNFGKVNLFYDPLEGAIPLKKVIEYIRKNQGGETVQMLGAIAREILCRAQEYAEENVYPDLTPGVFAITKEGRVEMINMLAFRGDKGKPTKFLLQHYPLRITSILTGSSSDIVEIKRVYPNSGDAIESFIKKAEDAKSIEEIKQLDSIRNAKTAEELASWFREEDLLIAKGLLHQGRKIRIISQVQGVHGSHQ